MTDFVRVLDGGTEISPSLGTFCGSQRVSSLKSSGNLVLVQFVQTGSGDNYAGFTATARIGDCGGTIWGKDLSELRDKLRSGTPFDCAYQVAETSPVYTFRLTVTGVTIPESPGCAGDSYFEVRDKNATGPVLARVCGANQTFSVTSTENRMYIHAKTSGAPQSTMFRIRLLGRASSCGGTLSAYEGDIQTTGFPAEMPARSVCRWALNAPRGRQITVNFLEGDISNCDSTLTITDGVLTLTVPCNTSFPYVYGSFTSGLLVSMRAPAQSTVHGFRAHYDTQNELPCYQSPQEPNGLLVPSAAALQARPSMCIWSFAYSPNVTLAYKIAAVNITAVNADCKEEYIRGYETLCNAGSQGRSLMRRGSAEITYIKKHSLPSGGINTTYKINECGGAIRVVETPSFFTSPAYPDQYTRNADCVWMLAPTVRNAQVELNFTAFELETDCTKDYVEILSGTHARSPRIDKYCGSRRPPLLRGNEFSVIFHSDGDGSAPGFNFSVILSGLPCGGFRHIRNVAIVQTPNYPLAYPANTECDWVLDAQRGHRVNITFTGRFDVQQSTNCARDYVQIFNEVDGVWTSPVKYCGLTNPPSFVSSSHKARLLFRSDGTMQGDGFYAVATLACGDNYTEPLGRITSPRYPNEYEGNLKCDYIITVPQGSHVELTFHPQFDIEQWEDCRFDSLTIYEGVTDSSREILRVCGKESPGNLTVSSSVLIRFKTDWSVAGKGFALFYRVLACGGNLTGPIGTFGIEPSSIQSRCEWYITVTPDRAIEIRLLSLRGGWGSSSGDRCLQNLGSGVLIYDGNRTNLLYSYCGRGDQSPVTISSSNSVIVVVENRFSRQRNDIGFRALYRATLGPLQGCGGTRRMSTENRVTINWPPEGAPYPSDVNCVWRIIGTPGKILRLNFTEYQAQQSNGSVCSTDVIEVWDTLMSRDISRQSFCGPNAPPSILATGNIISLMVSVGRDGSRPSFKAVIAQEAPLCGGELALQPTAQTVSSPGFPSGAPAGTQCVWSLADNAVIHFTSFHIPCESGSLLHIMPARQGEKTSELCGDSVPHQYHTLQLSYNTNQRSIIFTAGPATNQARFQFNYSQPTVENRTYTSDSGVVMNTMYPRGSDLNRLPLIINISPRTRGGTLSLYFLSFSIGSPHSGTCAEEQMEVRDGETTSSRMLATLCGHANPNPVFSSTDRVTLVVHKGPSEHSWAPHVTFKIVYISSTQGAGCGGNLTHTEGAFSSPGFPNAIQEAKTCRWYIGVPSTRQMTLRFQALSLNSTVACTTNYVEIYEGSTEDDSSFVVRHCGRDHPAPYESRGNRIMVKLVTSGGGAGQGFYASFRMNDQDTRPSQLEYFVADA